ncbi:autotransporter-associated beta strand repeat-containing protein [Nitrosospira sp. Nsp11]|uniref:autotransporter-associated beta strand repeat-containing protein n=1 Tax=Nitrosospira sp. Nsp11 TaxID=1855338 RepID=UPI0009350951
MELTAANTYTGGTVLTSSTLLVSSDENLGAASGTLTFNEATLVNTAAFSTGRSITLNTPNDTFQTDGDLVANGVISGGGSLNKTGSGALILAGTNTYAGATTITAGTLQVGNGGTTGNLSGDVDVMNNAVLTFNRSDNNSYGGIISGTGLLNKDGAGVLALTGDSSGFGGHMFVNDGTLAIRGTLGGTLDVLARGRLQSTGTTGTTITAGTIAPGNSIGALTVDGNYTQLPGSTYEVEVEPGNRSDQIIVKGVGRY